VLLDNVARRDTPGLRRIILMDDFDGDLVRRGESCGVRVQAIQEVEVSRVSGILSGGVLC